MNYKKEVEWDKKKKGTKKQRNKKDRKKERGDNLQRLKKRS